jgi:hypothetical protein
LGFLAECERGEDGVVSYSQVGVIEAVVMWNFDLKNKEHDIGKLTMFVKHV